nr:MAG TPA: hypothetical protein [Caudoviricetes sp.]
MIWNIYNIHAEYRPSDINLIIANFLLGYGML